MTQGKIVLPEGFELVSWQGDQLDPDAKLKLQLCLETHTNVIDSSIIAVGYCSLGIYHLVYRRPGVEGLQRLTVTMFELNKVWAEIFPAKEQQKPR